VNLTRSLFSDHYLVTHSVGPHQQGIRLDAFLKERYQRKSREQLKRAISSGTVTVQRTQSPHLSVGRLKASSQLYPGDEVFVRTERKPEPEVSFDYKVLHEDENLLIIDKPANLPVHPAGRYFFHTLIVHLRTNGFKNPLRSERELFLVHRIDKETSGILVMAKNREMAAGLTAQFADRTTQKRYLAVVRGRPAQDEFSVDLAMQRALKSLIRLKMIITPEAEGGLPATTHFKRLATRGDFSLIECLPKTGRQHQIRVHLDAIGHPIVGDKLYGMSEEDALKFFDPVPSPYTYLPVESSDAGEEEPEEEVFADSVPQVARARYIPPELEARMLLPRHALHAAGIRFTHPLTKELLEFSSPLPQDLSEFLSRFPGEHLPDAGRVHW
jgi:23S rRNA pseudouridine1911/1915/1917 synthase